MARLVIISLLILATGCRSKCVRFAEKNPQCFTTVSDTVTEYDTIISERVTSDTVLRPSGDIDTFYLEIDKVRTRIIRHVDTLTVTQTVEPDTVIQTRTVIKTKRTVADTKKRLNWWVFVLIGAVAGLGLCAAFRR